MFLLKLDGEENQKIADMLQISEETVRSQLRRGKELLQNNVISFYVLGLICYWCDL
ncbi:MAG: sigma factor-like helix-turn-helix DNA-binding protein [Butyricimonas faecihominis]